MAHVEGGDKRYIRKEYAEIKQINEIEKTEGVEINAVVTEGQGIPGDYRC